MWNRYRPVPAFCRRYSWFIIRATKNWKARVSAYEELAKVSQRLSEISLSLLPSAPDPLTPSPRVPQLRCLSAHRTQQTFKTTIDEDAPEFTPYLADEGAAMHAAILDANAVAQERGLECACALVEYGGKRAAVKVKDTVLTGLLEKGLWGASRAGTKKLATELCLLLVECEGTAATVLQNCLDGLSSKQPKAVAGAVAVMKEIVR